MPNYRYNLKQIDNSFNVILSDYHIIHIDNNEHLSNDDIISAILLNLLEKERSNRYNTIMSNYNGDLNDINDIYNFLPIEYKAYAKNLDDLLSSMCSLDEIVDKYYITNIELITSCYGCLNERLGQKDHMECDIGCLHDPNTCFNCSY